MKFLLAIPVFNEEKNLENVILNTLKNLPPQIDKILLINDGSTDQSPHLINIFVKKHQELDSIHRKNNAGYGASMISAMKYAKKHGYSYLITMDCDLQHSPEDLKFFVNHDFSFDVVSGSRYLPASKKLNNAPEDRVLINTRITEIINHTFGWKLTDSFCGFKRYKISSVKTDLFTENGYAFPMEFWAFCYKNKLSIKEIPVSRIYTTDDRSFGEDLDHKRKRYKYYLHVLKKSIKKFKEDQNS